MSQETPGPGISGQPLTSVTVTAWHRKPVANALTLELEPVVADNLARFLDTADEWYARLRPVRPGRDFAFLGGGTGIPPRSPAQGDRRRARGRADHQDNLAGYHREARRALHPRGQVGPLAGPLDLEETLHAIALREYFMVTRNIDPNADEEVRRPCDARATRPATTPRSRRWCSWRSMSVPTR